MGEGSGGRTAGEKGSVGRLVPPTGVAPLPAVRSPPNGEEKEAGTKGDDGVSWVQWEGVGCTAASTNDDGGRDGAAKGKEGAVPVSPLLVPLSRLPGGKKGAPLSGGCRFSPCRVLERWVEGSKAEKGEGVGRRGGSVRSTRSPFQGVLAEALPTGKEGDVGKV